MPTFGNTDIESNSGGDMCNTITIGYFTPTSSGTGDSITAYAAWYMAFCVAEGTKITMYDYTTKNIEDIVIGDKVLSYDTESNKLTIEEVTETLEFGDLDCIKLNDLIIDPKQLVLTPKGLKPAKDLLIGETYYGLDDGGISKIVVNRNEEYGNVNTYDFIVNNTHLYFANNVLVYNYKQIKAALYLESDDSLVANSETSSTTLGNTASWDWRVMNFGETKPVITAGTKYGIAVWGETHQTKYLADNDNGESAMDSQTYGTWPNPCSPVDFDEEYSFYCTYTESAGGGSSIVSTEGDTMSKSQGTGYMTIVSV